MTRRRIPSLVVLPAALAFAATGCRTIPDQDLQPSLRRLDDPARMPDLAAGGATTDDQLAHALERSLAWFDRPGSRSTFPFDDPPITHERARASVAAFRELLDARLTPDDFTAEVQRRFDVYESVGRDGAGTVLFTAYFAPEYRASRDPSERYRHPLYAPPPDLAAQLESGGVWHARRVIEERRLLAGHEIAWLEDPLDAYLAHVNGSARLVLPDGSAMHVGHAATNERAYTSLGRLLIEAGLAAESEMSMQKIRELHRHDASRVETLMLANERYVFFREVPATSWPKGALGVPLTPRSSLATDKTVFPPGGVVLVDAEAPDADGRPRPFVRFMLDQDRGGAIQTPGRADVYMGVGDAAGAIAGRMVSEGRLYYLFLKE